jgi:mannose-6-phosphate isomerase-like protein (cupin superfamily)
VSGDARDLIPEYVLGTLSEEDRRRVHDAVDGSAALGREVRLTSEALASLADALPARPATPGGRARLLATLTSPDRFKAFFPTLRRWYDLDDDQLRAVLSRIDAGTDFIDAPLPGVRYFDFPAGPAAVCKEAGALTLAAGAIFPRHVHHGNERSMVLEGTLLVDGRRLHPGDTVEVTAGSEHEFSAGPERPLVLLVIHDGISLARGA